MEREEDDFAVRLLEVVQGTTRFGRHTDAARFSFYFGVLYQSLNDGGNRRATSGTRPTTDVATQPLSIVQIEPLYASYFEIHLRARQSQQSKFTCNSHILVCL